MRQVDGSVRDDGLTGLLTNNGLMYLFSNISYRLSNREIESVHHPGQATTIGLLKYPIEVLMLTGLSLFVYVLRRPKAVFVESLVNIVLQVVLSVYRETVE